MVRPFRLTTFEPSEDDFQASVADLLDRVILPPAMWWPMPIGHVKLTHAQAARLSRIGVKRGLPDIMVLYERIYGIELKRRGTTLSKTRYVRNRRSGGVRVLDGQIDVFPRLERAGMVLAVCRTTDEVLETLTGWRVPVRWHL